MENILNSLYKAFLGVSNYELTQNLNSSLKGDIMKLSNEMIKRLSKEEYYSQERFIEDAKSYIKAAKAGRIIYTVTTVSSSGMSRCIDIKSYEGTKTKGYFRNYYMMLKALGYSFNKYDEVRVNGYGMNMLFATNYNIIHSLYRMKFITKKTCDILAQKVN